MTHLKHLVLAAIGLSMLAVPAAQAQPRHDGPRAGVHRPAAPPPAAHRPHVRPAPSHAHRHWSKGQRYNDWRRHSAVRDYHRYGLRRPGPGQRWIKVNNDYLLVSTATGLIASIMAGR